MKTTKDGRRARRRILDFLVSYRESQGYPPSVRDIATWTSIPPATVFYHLGVLEREGVITRREGKARSWIVVK